MMQLLLHGLKPRKDSLLQILQNILLDHPQNYLQRHRGLPQGLYELLPNRVTEPSQQQQREDAAYHQAPSLGRGPPLDHLTLACGEESLDLDKHLSFLLQTCLLGTA